MKAITQLPLLRGARVIIRVDYNVPLAGNRILDTRRIESSYKTIDTVLAKGGVPVLLAHKGDGTETLKPIARYLAKRYTVLFISETIEEAAKREVLRHVQKGTVVLLENIRRDSGEEKNTRAYAKKLASLGSYYVNDAFSVSHRPHASIVGVPKLLPSYAGFQLLEEIKQLSKIFSSKTHPSVFIFGGAKLSTKLPLIRDYSTLADNIIIAGATLNNFYAVIGFEVGKSVVEKGFDALVKTLSTNEKLLLPVDIIVFRENKKVVTTPAAVQKNDVIVDIGPQSCALIAIKIAKAKQVVWNGPTGWYEKGFTAGTRAVARAIIESKARAIIGGGDTGAVIEKLLEGKTRKNIFVSTGGGATLQYLMNKTLIGITALD